MNETLEILSKLENFRQRMQDGTTQPGTADWVARVCQAIVAEGHYNDRVDWVTALKTSGDMDSLGNIK